jgi:hypothetical protein
MTAESGGIFQRSFSIGGFDKEPCAGVGIHNERTVCLEIAQLAADLPGVHGQANFAKARTDITGAQAVRTTAIGD